MFQDESIRYFDEPGPQNTDALIEVVKERMKSAGINYVVVASESGNTALKVAGALKEFKVRVVCVSAYAGLRLAWPEGGKWPRLQM
ncbi:MAG: Pyruvate kinase, alpha/beta domain [Candidatus Bathyarchaeota archaeon BA1]|nr:MAG: Pyruvate kinase, alpha/beta domain [Candidatus Bathyarchaeota archaeon BA1]